jgi:hypothetical protein
MDRLPYTVAKCEEYVATGSDVAVLINPRDRSVTLYRKDSASRTDRGNLSYDVFRSADDPGSFFIVERWVSAAALAAHERTPIFNEVGRNILNRYAEFHDALSGVTL